MRAKKRPVPHPGSSTRPPEKPMRRNARQIAATHEFRGEMRVLGDAGEAREFARRDELLQVLPEGVPALREGVLGGSAKDVVRKVARAEGREERETLLLFRSRVPRLLLDLEHQSDGGDVVRRARLPVGGEAAGGREAEVQRRNNDRRGGVFLGLGDRVVGRLAEGETGIEAHRGGQGGRVEERQAQLVGGRLHCGQGPFGRARSTGGRCEGAAGIGLMGIEGRGAAAAQAGRSVRRLRPRSEAARAAHRPPCRDRRRRGHAPDGGRGSIRRSDWRRPRREKSRACRP